MSVNNTRDSKLHHVKNNTEQALILLQDEVDITCSELDKLKKTLYDFKRDYDITLIEQKRDKKDLEESLSDNLQLISNLNTSINTLSETLRDPVTGLIVKLNEAVRSTNDTLNLIQKLDTKYTTDIKVITDTNTSLKERVKQLEDTIETIKKYYWYIVGALIIVIVKSAWEFFTKGG